MLSDESERRISEMMNHPTTCPTVIPYRRWTSYV